MDCVHAHIHIGEARRVSIQKKNKKWNWLAYEIESKSACKDIVEYSRSGLLASLHNSQNSLQKNNTLARVLFTLLTVLSQGLLTCAQRAVWHTPKLQIQIQTMLLSLWLHSRLILQTSGSFVIVQCIAKECWNETMMFYDLQRTWFVFREIHWDDSRTWRGWQQVESSKST